MLTGRYYFGDSDQSFPFAQLAGGLLPGFNTVTPTRVQLIALSYVKVVNSTQVNEVRLGWNRFAEGFFPQDQSFNPNSIGLDTGVGAYDGGLPATTVGGFSQIGATNSVPRNRVDTNWHFVDNYSWKSGKHDVKFGYEFRRTTINHVIDHTFRGTLSFETIADSPITKTLHCLLRLPERHAGRRRQVAGNSQSPYVPKQRRRSLFKIASAPPRGLTLNYRYALGLLRSDRRKERPHLHSSIRRRTVAEQRSNQSAV